MAHGQYFGVLPTESPTGDHAASRNAATVEHSADRLGLTFDSPDAINWARRPVSIEMAVQAMGLNFDALADVILTRHPGEVAMICEQLGVDFDAPDALDWPRRVAIVEMLADRLGLTFETPAASDLPRNVATVEMLASNLGLDFDPPGDVVWGRRAAEVGMIANQLGLSFASPDSVQWTRTPAEIDMIANNLGLAFEAPGSVEWQRHAAEVDMQATSIGLTFSPTTTGTNARFNGTNAYLWRTDAGYLSGVNSGTFWVWFRSTTPLGQGTEQTLFAASNGATPRIEIGLRSPLDTELYIETDDGTPLGTQWWRLPLVDVNLFDGQWHLLTVGSNGSSYAMSVDGQYKSGGYGTDSGTWFGHVAASAGSPLTMVSAAAFRRNGTVDQFYQGELDEMAMSSFQFSNPDLLQLYNSGNGWKIPEIQSDWPTLYTAISQAWELTNLDGKTFGREYKTADNDYFNVENVTQGDGGIIGIGTP